MRGNKYIFVLLVALFACLLHNWALAQSSNSDPCGTGSGPPPRPDDDRFIGVCDLDTAVHNFNYDNQGSDQGYIGFSIRSCHTYWGFSCSNAREYTVEVGGPAAGGYLVLSGSGGNLPLELTFTHPSSGSETLSPYTESNSRFAGATNGVQTPVEFGLSLPDVTGISPGVYSGTFDFYLYQCETWAQPWSICKNSTWNGRTELNPPVSFTISLTVLPRIIVKNFNDVNLSAAAVTPGQPIEGYEDICVGGIFTNYTVMLSSDSGSTGGSGSSPFQLNGVSQNLPYTAAFIDNTSSTSGITADASGNISGSFPRAGDESCNSDNARIIVSVAAADWESANETSYSDTLTVTVTSQ